MNPEDHINIKALDERLGGDFSFFKELAGLFLSDSPRLLSAIEEAVKGGNGEKIGKTAHTMKGAVANFSAERAFAAALELEKVGKNNELEKVDDAYKKLADEIGRMREALKILIDKPGF